MPSTFKVTPNSSNSFDYFTFHGNIDAQAETQLKELPLKVRRPVVKFDFSKTGRINSMGIALLLRCFKTIKEEKQADIRLVELNQTNSMLFKMTGVFFLANPEK
jgi:anti-anti-sigma regulatory factor